MDEPRTRLCRGLCLFFMILQNLLISNLPGAKMATLGNFLGNFRKVGN